MLLILPPKADQLIYSVGYESPLDNFCLTPDGMYFHFEQKVLVRSVP